MFDTTDKAHASRVWKRSVDIVRNNVRYTLKYDSPNRYQCPAELEGTGCFQQRGLNAALFKGDEYIGFIEFECYRFDVDKFTPKRFAYEMDAIDGDTYEFGLALGGAWSTRQLNVIVSLGYVLEFHRVWIRPEHRPCFAWVDGAEYLIRTAFRGHSIILMCAAPMELADSRPFHRKITFTKDEKKVFHQHREREERHRHHMIRAYQRLLGVQSLPGQWGKDGWLWRPRESLSHLISKPRLSRVIDPYD